jgi:CTP:molybdopterin cytidylyltransferase MocA
MPSLSRSVRQDVAVARPAVVGIVLAAGAGLRLGLDSAKPLVTDSEGRTWLERSVDVLHDGGIPLVYVVVGADAAAVGAVVPRGCRTVFAADWEEGMGASLRSGLGAVQRDCPEAAAAVVMLVDTPGVGSDVIRRLVEWAHGSARMTDSLVRATYGGEPGHPVLIGREHWYGVLSTAAGDRGARDYLRAASVDTVECGDLGSGDDVDTAQALAAWSRRSRHL